MAIAAVGSAVGMAFPLSHFMHVGLHITAVPDLLPLPEGEINEKAVEGFRLAGFMGALALFIASTTAINDLRKTRRGEEVYFPY